MSHSLIYLYLPTFFPMVIDLIRHVVYLCPLNTTGHMRDVYRYEKGQKGQIDGKHICTKLGSVAMETLTEDTASSKPSDPQLITSANTPSKQTLRRDRSKQR